MKKDVSDMDYEKAYKDALERARKIKHDVQSIGCTNIGYMMDVDMLELIFPELRESEDERIRKGLINFLQKMNRHANPNEDWDIRNRWIPWLEKQKEIRDPFDDEQFCRGYEAGYKDAMRVNKPVEKQDYSGLTDFERAIHRGFLCAGVENVPVTIIKETAQDCLSQIRAEIERLKGQLIRGACAAQIEMETNCKDEAYNEVLSFLDTLEEKPTPEGLDEAAFKYSSGSPFFNTEYSAFKAGAEWAFGQGMIREGKIVSESGEVGWIEYDTPAQVELMEHFKKGDEIVLQIRKKN